MADEFIEIPIDRAIEDASFFDLQVNLEGSVYTLEFRWNDREQSWYMSIWDADQEIGYAAGIKLVSNWLLRKYTADKTPPGEFFLLDTAADVERAVDPGFDDLGNRHQLFYVMST